MVPTTVEQVQAIVRIANAHRIPLYYPIATGKNLGYGGSAPNLSGSVVVDLKRMNRILEVDDRRGFALVEPGVSYFDLYRHIEERGLKVWIDCPDPGWGSPVGNALDHGVGYTFGPFRDHFGSHCGMEVVLPNGELLRTGMGALPKRAELAGVSLRLRAIRRRSVRPRQLRHRDEDGLLAHAAARGVSRGLVLVPRRRDLIPLVDHVNYLEHASLIGQPNYGCPLQRLVPATEPELARCSRNRADRPTTSSIVSPRRTVPPYGNASSSSMDRRARST